ncbi:hypothetical protein DYU05_00165 [Mucilaginibacter terrenus]|uniref:Uncharacterized protein n=1 Tax=Mucilaginibacter terrenus TaxID=2482727 RepID=A0A3E2NTA5_9SPHI|nr:hypothetical protein DYU05_00165 [Mucilaginibacter terrenus]
MDSYLNENHVTVFETMIQFYRHFWLVIQVLTACYSVLSKSGSYYLKQQKPGKMPGFVQLFNTPTKITLNK